MDAKLEIKLEIPMKKWSRQFNVLGYRESQELMGASQATKVVGGIAL